LKKVAVIISAGSEWRMVNELLAPSTKQLSPYGEWFIHPIVHQQVIFVHSGVGKVASAGATQFIIDKWQPDLLINLGTCGGLEGSIQPGQVILVTETLIYDIFDQMGNEKAAIQRYMTQLDLSFLTTIPHPVIQTRMVSADRDISPTDIAMLKSKFKAVAADWESGAIAWVAQHNHVRCLILRGVTDLVSEQGGESYGNIAIYHSGTRQVMTQLLHQLPDWLAAIQD
jgi:adenosylhomocysteine nucleosidase